MKLNESAYAIQRRIVESSLVNSILNTWSSCSQCSILINKHRIYEVKLFKSIGYNNWAINYLICLTTVACRAYPPKHFSSRASSSLHELPNLVNCSKCAWMSFVCINTKSYEQDIENREMMEKSVSGSMTARVWKIRMANFRDQGVLMCLAMLTEALIM